MLLLLNMVDTDQWNSTVECLVCMNRLSACREVCIVGTRCRDGVKVLWCHSHLVWLVF